MYLNNTTEGKFETSTSYLQRKTTLKNYINISTILQATSTAKSEIFSNMTLNVTAEIDSMDYDALLRKENSFEARALTPVTVYLVILMIIGVFGNSLVLYIYKFRFRRSSSRMFILSLAVFDLITCVLGMPFHIMDMTYPYLFVWDAACKILSFALCFTILASIYTLNLIAVDRYRKICKPFAKQLSGKGSKALCWVIAIVALISAIPMLLIYGSSEVPTRVPNVTGMECYNSEEYAESWFPLIYNAFIFLIFIVSVFILIGFYSKVGRTVWKRRKITEDTNESKRSASSTPSTSLVHLNVITDDKKHHPILHARFSKEKDEGVVHIYDKSVHVSKPNELENPYKPTTTASPKITQKDQVVKKARLQRLISEPSSEEHDSASSDFGSTFSRSQYHKRPFTKKQKRTIRITAMLFVITLIFVISFLPYLVISIIDAVDFEFWVDMPLAELVIMNLLMRTYFINNMINPIIYYFLDHKFKEEVLHLFQTFRMCKPRQGPDHKTSQI